VKSFHPPHLHSVTTLPNKTNTVKATDVGQLIREREHFSRNVMVSVGVSRMGKTSSLLERKLTASEKGLLPDVRTVYMSSLQVDTAAGWSVNVDHDGLSEKEHINFIEPHMWPPNSYDINPVDYAISGALQQQIYHQRQFKTVEELK